MSNTLLLKASAVVLSCMLIGQSACFGQALKLCPEDNALPGPGTGGAGVPAVIGVPKISPNMSADFNRANTINRLVDVLPEATLKAHGIIPDQVKSLPIQDRVLMFADVDAATNGKAGINGYKPTTKSDLNNIAQSISARRWVTRNSPKIDNRVLAATLGGDPSQVSGSDFVGKTDAIGKLAMLYGDDASAMGKVPAYKSLTTARLTAAFGHDLGTAQVYPGVSTPSGALSDTPPHVPFVYNKTQQCLTHATSTSWAVNPSLNRVSVAFDPAGFSDVGMLIHRIGPTATNGYIICSLTLLRDNLAVSAAHCTHTAGALAPAPLPGIRDPAQFLVLMPKANLNDATRDPTACFRQEFNSSRCQYYVGTVSSATVPTGTSWPIGHPLPSTDLAALGVNFPSGNPIAFAQADFSPPTKNTNVTLSGYGLTNALDVISKSANLEVGWQTLESVTTYGLSWVPSATGKESGACTGDSGGPIFLGDDYGSGEKHQLIGVVSFLDPTGADDIVGQCEKNAGHGVLLAPNKAWLCGLMGAGACPS